MAATSSDKAISLSPAEVVNDHLIEELRRRIVDHAVAPGVPLREQDLATEFGVSRARVRHAFNILEERGLIEHIRNRGAMVARLDPRKAGELFEVREVLEAQMVRLATERGPAESWGDLTELFGKSMDAKLARNDLGAYEDAVHLFRRRCIEAAKNEVLSNLLDSLYDRTHVLIRRLVLVPGRAQEGMRQHREILAAMRDGKAEKAERLKRKNIRSAREWFDNYREYLL
ncbi:MAG: GntR family transcriptional regulator [Rhodospirillaceae bacterium]|jgi:DNA-binding GntR family transcriptional regulator|nr:GntR family transcriptional regulator [Rhodospirillaceae bacterium]MBT5516269.1 GntR family transcriptional regulator [Rhodospirillaceae bacterium]MBT6087934.1 GntR family transcriptional regulator [Rhodospirillaceae bacterium]